MEAWQRWGMNLRVLIAPPLRGAAIRHIFGTLRWQHVRHPDVFANARHAAVRYR
jgi:hypothetical protein